MSLRRALAVLPAGAGLVLAAPASSLAAPQVALRPAAATAGTPFSLAGSGFAARERIVVKAPGAHAIRVRASRRGTFSARLTVPRRSGWVRVVSRGRGRRVVNHFHVVARGGGDVVELSSSRGPSVRVTPRLPLLGAGVQLRGRGYGARARLRIAWLGHVRRVRATRSGRLRAGLGVPATTRPGAHRLRLSGRRARFRVTLRIAAPPPASPGVVSGAPTLVAAPAISGLAQSGRTLTATTGAWRGTAPIEYAFAWQSCAAGGQACVNIRGATGRTYTLVDGDRGHRVRVLVTASNAAGSATAAAAETAIVTAIPGVVKSPVLPTAVQQGQTVKVTSAVFSNPQPDSVRTQWLRCADSCAAVGTNSHSYKAVAADVGFRLQVVQTATGPGGTIQTASNKTDPVEPAATPTGLIALWHMNDRGSTMTDSAGHHDGAMRNVATGVAGFSGTAFGFNGASSYGTVANASDLSAVSNNVTLTMHMRATALPPPTIQDWDLIRSSGGYYDGDEYKMEYAPDGTAHCSFKGDGATGYKEVASSAARPLDDGRWHTVQCVKTQTQVKTVVDGTVYAQSAVIGNIVLTQGLIVGAHPNAAGQGGSEFYNGTLDEASLAFSKPSP
jgi:Concanavalin A-like lectin/glucanases superfamily